MKGGRRETEIYVFLELPTIFMSLNAPIFSLKFVEKSFQKII
jgi:hypothetical protein